MLDPIFSPSHCPTLPQPLTTCPPVSALAQLPPPGLFDFPRIFCPAVRRGCLPLSIRKAGNGRRDVRRLETLAHGERAIRTHPPHVSLCVPSVAGQLLIQPPSPPSQEAVGAGAVAVEQQAYSLAASRVSRLCSLRGTHPAVSDVSDLSVQGQYDAACTLAAAATPSSPVLPPPQSSSDQAEPAAVGDRSIRIGTYARCHYVASGVTAEVFRCGDRALKVITASGDMAPHSPAREAQILRLLRKPCIPLLETFRDQEQRFVLVFPYMPLTLADLLDRGPLSETQIRRLFADIFGALDHLHTRGIVHRDVKPSAMLLASPEGPLYLSDFGTAWHPELSAASEPPDRKILDIGTGPYRAPEVLFGDKAYGPPVDMWGAGTMLAECCRRLPKPLFESRAAHEDGNQLGLILSIFKTLGTPTPETWPEAASFKTPPFEMYRMFPPRPWDEILPDVDPSFRSLVADLVRYDSKRASAQQVSRVLFASTRSCHIIYRQIGIATHSKSRVVARKTTG